MKAMADNCVALPGMAACTICPPAELKVGAVNTGTCLCSCTTN